MTDEDLIPNYFSQYSILEGTVGIIAVIGNLLIIIAFFKVKQTRSRTNYYIVSLAFADLLVGIIEVPACILVSFCLLIERLWNVSLTRIHDLS